MQKTDNGDTKIALINNNISYIQKDISEIKMSVKELAGAFITKVQFEDALKPLDQRLGAVEKTGNTWKILSPVISSIATAVVTFLLISFIQNAK